MQGQWVVDCSKCGCNMEDHTTQSQAESAWNTRAPDPRVEGLVKALKEAFKEGLELGYRHGFGGNIEKGLWLNSKARAALAEYEKETEKK